MATADSVKAKIQGLIAIVNQTTGGTSADMTEAVDALIAGYGQGGGNVPSGTRVITENGTYDVAAYASAQVEVPTPAETSVARTITIPSDLGNGVNTTKTVLTEDPFVKKHYGHDSFSVMFYPITQIVSEANVVHSVYHGNFNIGSTNIVRYGFCYYSSSASAISSRAMTVKLNGNSYNVAFRAKDTGDLDLYVESSRIVKAGTYLLVMTCNE